VLLPDGAGLTDGQLLESFAGRHSDHGRASSVGGAIMQCSNCGKEIPFTGNVCPHCHANKERDQQVYALAMGLFFLIAIPGGIAYIFYGNYTIGCVALIIAVLASAIVGAVGTARNKAAAKKDAEEKKGNSSKP
jgi:hypothetical protein